MVHRGRRGVPIGNLYITKKGTFLSKKGILGKGLGKPELTDRNGSDLGKKQGAHGGKLENGTKMDHKKKGI